MAFSLIKSIFRRMKPSANNLSTPNRSGSPNDFYAEGILSAKQGNVERALQLFETVLAENPRHYLAYVGMGNVYYLKGDYTNAIDRFQKAFELEPDSPALLINYGNALRFLGKPELALPLASKATDLAAENPDYLTNLALVYQDLGQMEQAKACFMSALRLSPSHVDARLHFALLHLLRGKLDLGWPDYELRLVKNDPPVRQTSYPRWAGQRADGGLLIYAEQGVGDEIMFASCINDALQLVKNCVIDCSPKLASLFQRSFPGALVIGEPQDTDLDSVQCPWDITFAAPIGSLPLLFRKTIDDFPIHSGYLKTDSQRALVWKSRIEALGPGLKVGISWRGGTPKTRGHLRSIPLAEWSSLIQKPGLHFVSLQHGVNGSELDALRCEAGERIHYWPGIGDDLDEAAAIIENLDLVISVDNTVVQLAGALGQPTWALVPACPEWRYLAQGEVMPWYPSVRIFRQTQLGDWSKVFSTLVDLIDTQSFMRS